MDFGRTRELELTELQTELVKKQLELIELQLEKEKDNETNR